MTNVAVVNCGDGVNVVTVVTGKGQLMDGMAGFKDVADTSGNVDSLLEVAEAGAALLKVAVGVLELVTLAGADGETEAGTAVMGVTRGGVLELN